MLPRHPDGRHPGMAALVPFGAYELIEATKLYPSSTAGRSAFRDLEVRGFLQPKLWVDTQMGMLIDRIRSTTSVAPRDVPETDHHYPYVRRWYTRTT